MSDHLGPAHPCLGCQHRGETFMAQDRQLRRVRPGSQCRISGVHTVLFVGDPLPTWCPEPKGRK